MLCPPAQGDFVVAERYVTMSQLCSAVEEQRVRGMFGCGTACVICPIGKVVYQGKVTINETEKPVKCAGCPIQITSQKTLRS